MPAYTQPAPLGLVVSLVRGGEAVMRYPARGPHDAVHSALLLLARQDALYAGDRIEVEPLED